MQVAETVGGGSSGEQSMDAEVPAAPQDSAGATEPAAAQ